MTGRVVRIRKPAESTPKWSDEAVAHAVSSGDPAAVAEMFDRFHGPVSRYLSRIVGSGPDVDDLLQNTFMQVARGQTRFEGRSTVLTWLLGIATNVARHHVRSKVRQDRLLQAVAQESAPALEPDPGAAAEARQVLRRAQRVLDGLPDEQRFAFVLCELEGLRARDAARILETSETSVWKKVSDARKALRLGLERGKP